MKASSSTGGVKNLLLQHVEKMVLGVAMILVALFLWSAMGVKPIDDANAPEKLVAAANSETQRIDASTAPVVDGPELRFESGVAVGLEPIPVAAYVHTKRFNPELQPPIVKRPEPTLLALEDIRATPVVISVPEIGSPPTWKDEADEKTKKAVKKIAPKTNLDGGPRRRGGRGARGGAPGYGGAPGGGQPGYGGVPGGGQPGYGATGHAGARGRGTGADRSAADQSYGTGGGEGREAPGYGGVAAGGYGGGGGIPGAKPGVAIQGVEVKGVIRTAVVLTGRVPYSKQFDEFQSKFKEAIVPEGHTPELDNPIYNEFKVERQEVTAAGDGKWIALDLEQASKDEARWALPSEPDQVDTNYAPDNYLAWPLPPTIQRSWGRLASHPTIPFMWMADETSQMGLNARGEGYGAPIESRRRTGAQMDGGFGGYGAPGGGYGAPRGGYGAGGHGASESRTRGGFAAGETAIINESQPAPEAHVPSLLFRFVDTQKIEAGKQYRYRVTLVMQNPNFQLDPRILEDTTSSQKETRLTPPAESGPVTVPHDRTLFAVSSKVSNRPLVDFSGQVLFHVWDHKMGAEVAKEFELNLGEIADFVDTVENWYNPYTGLGEKLENFTFRYEGATPMGAPMLADIAGGAPLPGGRGVDQPTEMLFIDANGRMFTSNEARDSAAQEFYKERYSAEPPPDASEGLFGAPEAAPARGAAAYGGSR